jgi:hypothetical protein
MSYSHHNTVVCATVVFAAVGGYLLGYYVCGGVSSQRPKRKPKLQLQKLRVNRGESFSMPPPAPTPTYKKGSQEQFAEDQNKLREIFDALDIDGSHVITKENFANASTEKLHLGLSGLELKRMFLRLGCETMNFKNFCEVVRKNLYFKSVIVSNYDVSFTMKVAAGYNYDSPTHENYAHADYTPGQAVGYNENDHGPLFGEFADVRKKIDYNWNYNFSKERQLWQDKVVVSVALKSKPQPFPWLIFTCGPMGAGKGFTLRWMSQSGVFPLEDVVRIDMDHVKSAMPEWKNYVAAKKEMAGTQCHKESGYIAEICQEVSLRSRQNTCIDGSLQDYRWWGNWIKNVKNKYPWYKIAIFYVYCRDETVFQRAESRGKVTGRYIPKDILAKAITNTRISVEKLSPLADFVVHIDNDGTSPKLNLFEDRSGSFRAISERFRVKPPEGKFPDVLSPLYLFSVDQGMFSVTKPTIQWSALFSMAKSKIFFISLKLAFPGFYKTLSPKNKYLGDLSLAFSAIAYVNFDSHSKKAAGIPENAVAFSWCYGVIDPDSMADKGQYPPDIFKGGADPANRAIMNLFYTGGYVYFSKLTDGKYASIVATNAACAGSTWEDAWRWGGEREFFSIEFRLPEVLPAHIVADHRWITQEHLGAKMCWLLPNEIETCPMGGFAYQYTNADCEIVQIFFPCDVSN